MHPDTAREYYTVSQAADALGVSASTVWRWIKAQRLPALRLGPKAIRIRRRDVDAALRPLSPAPEHHTQDVYKSAGEIPPLTEVDIRRWREANARMDAHREAIFRRRKGRLMPDSAALIRREREKRSRQL